MKIQSHEDNTQNFKRPFITALDPKSFQKLPYHITGEWNSWALFPYLEDLVYLRGKNDKKEISFFVNQD